MAIISNPSVRAVTLPTGHVVPRLGNLTTTNDIIRCPDNWPTLNGLFLSGQIGLTFDPDEDSALLVLQEPVAVEPAAKPAPEAISATKN